MFTQFLHYKFYLIFYLLMNAFIFCNNKYITDWGPLLIDNQSLTIKDEEVIHLVDNHILYMIFGPVGLHAGVSRACFCNFLIAFSDSHCHCLCHCRCHCHRHRHGLCSLSCRSHAFSSPVETISCLGSSVTWRSADVTVPLSVTWRG